MFRSITFAAAAVCACATTLSIAAVTPAAASIPLPAASTARVRTADLDLATLHGQAVLDGRLRDAARMVCGTVGVETLAIVSACRRDAVAAARTAAPRTLG